MRHAVEHMIMLEGTASPVGFWPEFEEAIS